MIPFDWIEPDTLAEAVSLLDPEDSTIRVIAGGTALMLMMKAGVFTPSRLISLEKIEPEYSAIALEGDGLHIGAMASLSDLEQSSDAMAQFPVMQGALRTLSNVRVRNVARVGGALAHGDPHMDLPPLFAMLGAHVSTTKGRDIPVDELYAGYYETFLEKDELIATVHVPPLNGARAVYKKVTSRSADDWPALNLGVWLEAKGKDIQAARVVVSAATEKVTRLAQAESVLSGATSNGKTLERAAEAATAEVSFLSDAHGSAPYKKELLRVYLKRAIAEALA